MAWLYNSDGLVMARILPSIGRIFAAQAKASVDEGVTSPYLKDLQRWTDPKVAVPLAKLGATVGSNLYDKWHQNAVNEQAVDDLRQKQRTGILGQLLSTVMNITPSEENKERIEDWHNELKYQSGKGRTDEERDRSLERLREHAAVLLDDPNVPNETKEQIRMSLFPEGTGLKGFFGMQGGPSWLGVAPQGDPETTLYTGPDPKGDYKGMSVAEVARLQAGVVTPGQAFRAASAAQSLTARAKAQDILNRAYAQGMGGPAEDFEDLMAGGARARDEETLRKLYPPRFAPRQPVAAAQRPGINLTKIRDTRLAMERRLAMAGRLEELAGNSPNHVIGVKYADWKRHTGETLKGPNGNEFAPSDEVLVGIPINLSGKERDEMVDKARRGIGGTDEKYGLQLRQGYQQRRKAIILKKSGELGRFRKTGTDILKEWNKSHPGPVTSIPAHKEEELARAFRKLNKGNIEHEEAWIKMHSENPSAGGDGGSAEMTDEDQKKAERAATGN